MAKVIKKAKPVPKHYNEKLKINVGFHEAMQILADHANDKEAKKTTYKGRHKSGE